MLTRFEMDFAKNILKELREIRKALQKIADVGDLEKQIADGQKETHKEEENE